MSELLMIDDNPMDHLIIQKMLDRYELFKDSAHCLDGRIIIEFLNEYRAQPEHLPDIILTDLNMPHFSGWEFLEQFNGLYPSLKKTIDVYILSSSANDSDRVRAKLYPFVKDFYRKPVTRECLERLYLTYRDHRIAG
jgi:CheY-like chemotaxis protein